MKFKDGAYGWFNCKTRIALFFVLCFFGGLVKAQSPLVFKSYTVSEGLSHNFVRKTMQDSEGFIWIATIDGLNRFDGYTFKTYKRKPNDSTSLSSDNIMTLAEDKHGNLWIGTWGGGVCIYNRKLDNFKRIPQAEGRHDSMGIVSNFINRLYEDTKQRIWIGSYDKGLSLADPDKLTFTHYLHDPGDPASVSSNVITSITEDEVGKLWIGTIGGGLNHFDPKTEQFIHFMHQVGDAQSLSSNNVLSVLYDSKQRLWVGAEDKVLNLMKDAPGQFIHYKHQPDNPKSIGDHRIMDMEESDDHKIWIGTDRGLYIYNEEYDNFDYHNHKPFDPKSLSTNQIKSVNKDSRGGMWVGTYNGGVNFFDKSFIKIHHYYATPDTTSLSSNDVSAFLQLKEDHVLVATDAVGLNLFDKKKKKFTRFQHNRKDANSPGSNLIKSLLMDRKGRVWVGLWGAGIDRFHPEKRIFTHLKMEGASGNWFSSSNITCLAEDENGFIWASTWSSGIIKFHPDNNTFEHFTPEDNNPHSLSNRYAWAILADHENNIWVGNSNGILDLLDRKSGRFIHLDTKVPGESSSVILAIFEDSKNRIWIGFEGGGLKRLDRESQTFITYTMEDGLPSNYINSIEEDLQGNLWLGTNHGLTRFDPEIGNIKNYGLNHGLQSLQFNKVSSIHLPSGEMMFGGVNGFNLFHPDSLIEIPKKIPLVFTDFQIFNKPVPIGKKNSPLQTNINEIQALTLSYAHSVFSIEYAGLHFPDPENMQYKYRLKGFIDENWQQVGKERKVTYTNLDPGHYVFEVALANHNGENTSRTLSITAMPPWWQTWWARLLAGLLLGASLFTIFKLRLRSIKAHNKTLEQEVTERTVSLREANGELKELNTLIQIQKEEIHAQAEELEKSNHRLEEMVEIRTADLKKSNQELDNFVYRVSHDIRAPLSSVLGLVSIMEMDKDLQRTNEYLKMTKKSINKLDGFVKDILDYSRNARMKIEREEINFSLLVDDTLEELQYLEKADKLKVIKDFHLNGPYYTDTKRLHIIFRNMFSNAIKYQNPHIDHPFLKVKITSEKDGVVIMLKDNGIGIPPEESVRVFDMFYRGSELSTGSGIGLYIVKETVEKLKGDICMQSQLGAGTTFTIQLPNIESEI